MEQRVRIEEDRWTMAAEVTSGDAAPAPDVVELHAEIPWLRRALAGRAVINQALGMMMALVPCPRREAGNLLADVARHSHLSYREVAAAFVATSEGSPFPEHLGHALRDALRRRYAAERI